MEIKLSNATRRAITNYGEAACREAFELNDRRGEGPAIIDGYGKGCIQRGNAMINAGRELAARPVLTDRELITIECALPVPHGC